MKPKSKQPPGGRDHFCFLCQQSSGSWSRIEEFSFTSACPPKTLLFNEGDPPERLIAICWGVVRLFSRQRDGGIKMFRIARAGDLLGLAAVLLNQPYAFSAETVALCQVRFLKRSAFLSLLGAEPPLWPPVALEVAKRHYETLVEVKKDPLVRLVQLLLSFCEISEGPKPERAASGVKMTVQDMADSVGVSDRQMRRHLATLRKKGLMAREGGWLVVRDPPGLRHLLEKIEGGRK